MKIRGMSILGLFRRAYNGSNKRVARVFTPILIGSGSDHPLTHLGVGDGRWPVCTDLLPSGGVCYCVGVGTNATFDLELAKRGCEVHSFDPTPTATAYALREKLADRGVTFHQIGVWSETKSLRFFAPSAAQKVNYSTVDLHGTNDFVEAKCETLDAITERLGHNCMSVLKVDVEGSWNVILDHLLKTNIRPTQLCVEFDSPTSLFKILRMTKRLSQAGYRVAWFENENFLFIHEAAECSRALTP